MTTDPIDQPAALFSSDFDAYASGMLPAHMIRCVLCTHVPCDCPPFGTPAYLALVDARHGVDRGAATPAGAPSYCRNCGHRIELIEGGTRYRHLTMDLSPCSLAELSEGDPQPDCPPGECVSDGYDEPACLCCGRPLDAAQ